MRNPVACRPSRAARALALAAMLPTAAVGTTGCGWTGAERLSLDQMGFTAALGDGLKRQMLLNMVRMRYADVPAFVAVSQLISGYTLQGTGQAGLNAYPNATTGNLATLSGTLQYTARPTFTFTPVTGERFAQSYLRPLSPAELLSLAQSGAPIDVLFRLGVQSVNGLSNGATRGGDSREASEGFEALMAALREVQSAGAVSLRFERPPASANGRVHLLVDGDDRRADGAARRVKELLGAAPDARELEVVYGRGRRAPGQVAVLTRSVLQILYELGSQIEVPEADVRRGETPATEFGAEGLRGRLVAVRHGGRPPSDAYAAVEYRGRWFWIDAGDYRSKAVFAFAHILEILAESGQSQPTPVVTIPAQ